MPRQVCLAAPTGVANSEEKGRKFSVIERAPLGLSAHDAIWNTLRSFADRTLIIDEAHPEEGFPADLVDLAGLPEESLDLLRKALASTRNAALKVEQDEEQGDPLAKSLNNSFDQQSEWLKLRSVVVQCLQRKKPHTPPAKRVGSQGVLLLIDS